MSFVGFGVLFMCAVLASAKSPLPGTGRMITRDQVAQESSASFVTVSPNDAVQEINKSERTFNFLKGKPGASSGTYPAASSSYASASTNSYPAASYSSTANSGGRFFGLTSLPSSSAANKLQLGLSFIVPFLNLPLGTGSSIGGYSTNSGSSYYGTSTATSGSSNGISSLLALNPKSIIQVIVVALGALILIPLVLSLLTGISSSGIGRSEDVQDTLTSIMAQVDNALQSYNIDASSCMSRAICTYVRSATKKVVDGSAGSSDKIIDGIATNSYVKSMVDGTSIAKAIEMGRKPGTTCIAAYPKCPYNVNALSRYLTSYISQMVEAPSEKATIPNKPGNIQQPQS